MFNDEEDEGQDEEKFLNITLDAPNINQDKLCKDAKPLDLIFFQGKCDKIDERMRISNPFETAGMIVNSELLPHITFLIPGKLYVLRFMRLSISTMERNFYELKNKKQPFQFQLRELKTCITGFLEGGGILKWMKTNRRECHISTLEEIGNKLQQFLKIYIEKDEDISLKEDEKKETWLSFYHKFTFFPIFSSYFFPPSEEKEESQKVDEKYEEYPCLINGEFLLTSIASNFYVSSKFQKRFKMCKMERNSFTLNDEFSVLEEWKMRQEDENMRNTFIHRKEATWYFCNEFWQLFYFELGIFDEFKRTSPLTKNPMSFFNVPSLKFFSEKQQKRLINVHLKTEEDDIFMQEVQDSNFRMNSDPVLVLKEQEEDADFITILE